MTHAQAIEQLRRAILNEGRWPSHHREVLARHRREWPTLWEAIDQLLHPSTAAIDPPDLRAAGESLDQLGQPRHWRIVEAPDGGAPSIVRVNPPEEL